MSARAWEAILAAWSDTDGLVQTTLPERRGRRRRAARGAARQAAGGSLDAAPGAAHPAAAIDLDRGGAAAARPRCGRARRAARRGGVERADGARRRRRGEADDRALAVHLDERVLGRLPPRFGPVWSRLQEDVIQSDDGGVKFYQNLDELLAQPQASTLVLEVYSVLPLRGLLRPLHRRARAHRGLQGSDRAPPPGSARVSGKGRCLRVDGAARVPAGPAGAGVLRRCGDGGAAPDPSCSGPWLARSAWLQRRHRRSWIGWSSAGALAPPARRRPRAPRMTRRR